MQEQHIAEGKKFLNERLQKKNEISMKMIGETSMVEKIEGGQEQNIDKLIKLKEIHLEWLNIDKIQHLEVFSDLTILYLQHNSISKIEGLDNMPNLQYLALNNNRISSVQNISHLQKLSGLNLSTNNIEEIDTAELPSNISVISFKQNPVCLDVDYKQRILKRLKHIEVLDDLTITAVDKFKILGMLPKKVSTYASQMRQFYTKRNIEVQLQEESKPVLLNTQTVDEKKALEEIKATTRKYKHQNQESFKKDMAEQNEFFQEKIEVSKKIRDIKQKQESKRTTRLKEIKEASHDKIIH